MENELLYTFTTIAQCAAAGFGLLGAFVLFRLQQIERDLRDMSAEFVSRDYFPNQYLEMRALRAHDRYPEFHAVLERAMKAWQADMQGRGLPAGVAGLATPWGEAGTTSLQNFSSAIRVRGVIRFRLWWAWWPTAATVFTATLAIPFTKVIECRGIVWPAIGFELLLFLVALGAFVWLISGTLGPK